jgi:hypothetical protein
MMNYEQMPQRIIDTNKRAEISHDIRKAVRDLQEAFRNLAEEQNICIPASADLNDWKQCLREADKRYEAAKQSINADEGLVASEKQQRLSAWRGWHRKIATNINTIIRCMEAYSLAVWVWDDTLATITPSADIEEVSSNSAIIDVPSGAAEHAKLISDVLQSITNLRVFEKEKNVSKYHLEQLCGMDAELLAEMWATGRIFRPDYSDPILRNAAIGREFAERQYL